MTLVITGTVMLAACDRAGAPGPARNAVITTNSAGQVVTNYPLGTTRRSSWYHPGYWGSSGSSASRSSPSSPSSSTASSHTHTGGFGSHGLGGT